VEIVIETLVIAAIVTAMACRTVWIVTAMAMALPTARIDGRTTRAVTDQRHDRGAITLVPSIPPPASGA
jgi:hypothetical protein